MQAFVDANLLGGGGVRFAGCAYPQRQMKQAGGTNGMKPPPECGKSLLKAYIKEMH